MEQDEEEDEEEEGEGKAISVALELPLDVSFDCFRQSSKLTSRKSSKEKYIYTAPPGAAVACVGTAAPSKRGPGDDGLGETAAGGVARDPDAGPADG